MAPGRSHDLQDALLGEIESSGPITFARFMDRCLYHPRFGYYTCGLGGGGGRDYVTSSGLHRAYGALMARQAEEMWRGAGEPAPYDFVEFGPGEGHFACDFLRAAALSPRFAAALRYVLVESSPALASRQRDRLARLSASRIVGADAACWEDLEALERRGVPDGCLFANEVLDAFPVHRIVGTADGAREIHVAAREGGLHETLAPLSGPEVAGFLEESGIRVADGQEVDVCLEAPRFMSRIAALLGRGHAVIVDYGRQAADLYHPARRRGTLLAYHRHRATEEFLSRPGEQDLTAHVDFTAIARAAMRSGMRVAGWTTQARFLLALGVLEYLEAASLPEREALKDMILPDRMGGIFRVLVLAKGDVPSALRGLTTPWADGAGPRETEATSVAPRAGA